MADDVETRPEFETTESVRERRSSLQNPTEVQNAS
jgi:hypothetical protein